MSDPKRTWRINAAEAKRMMLEIIDQGSATGVAECIDYSIGSL